MLVFIATICSISILMSVLAGFTFFRDKILEFLKLGGVGKAPLDD